MSTGLFIVFEGGEGSGKSTQAECLLQRLAQAGYPSVMVREPGTTTLGSYLRDYLKSKRPLTLESELLLFAAARAQLVTEEIRPALEKGITVIADRYTGSTVAYQGAGRGLNREVIDYVNDFVTGGLIPDVTLLLDSEPAEGLERVGSPQLQMALLPEDAAVVGREDVAGHRRFEDQAISFHRRVRRGYLELAGANPGWHIIDARLSIDELADQIWTIISPLLLKAGPDEAAADTAALVANNK